MILGAGLLLLVGLGLLVAGVLTGVTALYWGCVAVCLVAAVLLVLVRRQMASERTLAERAMAERAMADRAAPERAMAERAVPERPARRAESETTVLPPVQPLRAPEVGESRPPESPGDPPLEEVEVTDLLLVMDLREEVLVVDEHPRYHLSGCPHLTGRETFAMPLDEARSDGFTPCGTCAPDRHLAQQARERKAGRR